jgi:hypothetical protein
VLVERRNGLGFGFGLGSRGIPVVGGIGFLPPSAGWSRGLVWSSAEGRSAELGRGSGVVDMGLG